LCEIKEGQRKLGRLADKQSERLLEIMSREPRDRMYHIQQQVNALALDSAPMLKQLGLEVNTNVQEIDARIIEAPRIAYADGAQARYSPTCKQSVFTVCMASRTKTIQNQI
jgi:hypothetical protein